MTLFEDFKRRGMIAPMIHEDEIKDLLDNQKTSFYIGFDPTADSLHVGHFLQLVMMSRMQKAGHRPIAILGGGTGLIGDPTGRTDMRQMLTDEQIDHNIACFKKQMSQLVDFSDGKALILNNADWIRPLNYIEFLREIGVHFSVNRMLTFECFKTRLERGLSFIEFNYMLLQSFDFYKLFKDYGCRLELGGDDQWSNILGGIELVRRKCQEQVYGMTFSLLTTSDGKKMGKTMGGAVWLDPDKTSPYEFFQYWRNIDDADVVRTMKMLTFLPIEQIESYESLSGAELNPIKELLAFEITKMVHGEDEANKAMTAARSIFLGAADANMPSTALSADKLSDGMIDILSLLVETGLAPSKSEARRLVVQGGISVDEEKITDAKAAFSEEQLKKGVIIKKGKKVFHKVTL